MSRPNWFWQHRNVSGDVSGAGLGARSRRAVERAERAGESLTEGVARLERHVRNEEPFWPAQLAAAVALGLYLTLPNKVVIGPNWLIPAVEGVLLVGLIVSTPTRHRDQSPRRRALVIGLLAAVSLTTFVSLILLTHYLLQGGKAGGHPLIVAGILVHERNGVQSHGHDAADHDGQVPDGRCNRRSRW
jgi:hypothetical protein